MADHRRNLLLKIIVITLVVIVALIGISVFFVFGGFKQFEKNRAQIAAEPLTAFIEKTGGQKLCEEGDKGLDPFSGSEGSHSYNVYYTVKDSESLNQDLKNVSNSLGYGLEVDTDYIDNLQHDLTDPQSVPSDRKGIQYNAKSVFLVAHEQGKWLYLRIYRDSQVPLACSQTDQIATSASGAVVVRVFIHE